METQPPQTWEGDPPNFYTHPNKHLCEGKKPGSMLQEDSFPWGKWTSGKKGRERGIILITKVNHSFVQKESNVQNPPAFLRTKWGRNAWMTKKAFMEKKGPNNKDWGENLRIRA